MLDELALRVAKLRGNVVRLLTAGAQCGKMDERLAVSSGMGGLLHPVCTAVTEQARKLLLSGEGGDLLGLNVMVCQLSGAVAAPGELVGELKLLGNEWDNNYAWRLDQAALNWRLGRR